MLIVPYLRYSWRKDYFPEQAGWPSPVVDFPRFLLTLIVNVGGMYC